MLKRFRQAWTLLSFLLLLGVLTLWSCDDALVIRSMRIVEARSHVFVRHGALNVEYTGLYFLLRDLRQADEITLARNPVERLSIEQRETADAAGALSFRAQSRFVRRTPLQDLTDTAGQPIYMEQSVPMKLVIVPAWLVAILLAIAPGQAFARRMRDPRQLLTPFRYVRRRFVAIATVASIVVCLLWTFSEYRYLTVRDYHPEPSFHSKALGSYGGSLNVGSATTNNYDREPTFDKEIRISKPGASSPPPVIAALAFRFNGDGFNHSVPYWLLFIATAIVPLTWLAMRLWGWRTKDGHCYGCGYDLRASSDRCSECGRPIDEITVRPAGSQRMWFATSLLSLLLAGVMVGAWVQSWRPTAITHILRWDEGTALPFLVEASDGKLHLVKNANSMVVPMWLPVAMFLAFSGFLMWRGRRAGLPSPA